GNKELVDLTVHEAGQGDAGQAGGGTFTATAGHPIWSVSRGDWVDAGKIQVGELLRTSAGTYVQVDNVRAYVKRQRVINLTVEDLHTFFVVTGGTSVLTHNCGPGDAVAAAAQSVANEGIYVVRNAAGVVYVGQSGNITTRLSQHVSTRKFTQAEVDAAERFEVLGGKDAREVTEQLKLDSFGGRDAPGILNKVNPIGDRRLSLMPEGYVRP
ncbi:MAG: polymorphic toxin-type HINT domain-containing protein, partial [Nocardioides sp.]